MSSSTTEGRVLPERIDTLPTRMISGFPVGPGRALPFGATPVPGGVNFSVYSNHAEGMTLVLFRRGAREPLAELPFPPSFRIGGVYAMTVSDLEPEDFDYGYRAAGPFRPEEGLRFNPERILLDPYARLIGGREVWGEPGRPEDPYPYRARVPFDDFDWQGDRPLGLPLSELVIYELHVRGFTRHPSSGVHAPGTFAGLVEKIGYLRELGVNCVELMPVAEFDELDNPRADPADGRPLHNFWGYQPHGFFAPKASYAAAGRQGGQVDEFKNLVKELHRAGIEVVLDVVFNHTAEGNELGPTISFRGLDNSTYYLLTPEGRHYYNFSGTGNTLNCNHPVVRGFVLDCLRYWAAEFHIDGFRFDLAAVLGRAQDGSPMANPPLLEALAQDPVLRDCKLIAEAWDADGICLGGFAHEGRWSEWNSKYRDTVRRFLKGDPGMVGELATRLAGSSDLYARRGPTASINFVTAHDGFTLRDLYSYNERHNESNGEDNRDGEQTNHSWNCGHEGPTGDPEIGVLRDRQLRNALLLLLTSHGVPMLLAGDEVGRTQQGNNNAYCHDGPLSWFDWDLTGENADLLRFARCALAFRRRHRALRRSGTISGEPGPGRPPAVSWHGTRPYAPDWSPHCRLLAAMFYADEDDGQADCVYTAANAYWEDQNLELPEPPEGLVWHLFADTGEVAPAEVHEPGREPRLVEQSRVAVGARSVVVLVAGRPDRSEE